MNGGLEDLMIKASERSPEVSFSADKNELRIQGRSQPEDLLEFFKPILDWYNTYIDTTKGPVDLHIELDYFNTGSAKVLFEVLQKLNQAHQRGVAYQVTWVYEDYDDDMREAAEHLAELTGIELTLIAN